MTTKDLTGFKLTKGQIPKYLYNLMLLAYIALFAVMTFICNYNASSAFLYAAFLAFLALRLSKKHQTFFDSMSDTKLLIGLSVACFVVKFVWIYFMRVVPQVDYEMFYNTAVGLAESTPILNRYIALFPHIFGYSTFLSIFIKIFGQSVFMATFINVILTILSGILIYKILKNLISTSAGVCGYALWIACPSQTIYNSLVLSDPLYTTFILAFVYLVTVIAKKESSLTWIKMLFYGILSALILQAINVSRPIAMILIIAMFIWIFVLRFSELFKKEFLIKWLAFFAAMLIAYFSLGSLWNSYFTSRIGENPASVPGYNIHVGFNTQSNGTWNAEDSGVLDKYSNMEGSTADWAQKQMLGEAKARITSGAINFPSLFINKLNIFMGDDSSCIMYCNSIIQDTGLMNMICNVFFYFVMLLSILGAYKMFKTSHKSSVFILPLYVIGITCAQMLVEVAGRYHYSIIPFLIMISQFYIFEKRANATKPEEV